MTDYVDFWMNFAFQSYMYVDFNDSKMYGYDAKGGLYFHSYCKYGHMYM